MTAGAFNHTQASIEDVVSSAEYGKRMIHLADQLRRESNHDAANAAFMAAAQIRDQLAETMDMLPIISPEHAALLRESQRQRLLKRLGESHGSLNQLISNHRIDNSPMEDWDQVCEEWYALCLHIGYMAHLARGVAARAAGSRPNQELVDMTEYALGQFLNYARESMSELMEYKIPDDAPFPQTRSQMREQATSDHAEIEDINVAFREVVKAAEAEADDSQGRRLLGVN